MNELETITYSTHPVESEESRIASLLMEAADDWDDDWRMVGGEAPATYSGGHPAFRLPYTSLRDRDEGRHLPFYENEYDLKRQRAKSRRLATFTTIASGAMQALQVYCLGGDWEYKAVSRKNREAPEALLDEVQRVIDDNLDRNQWVSDLDHEIHDRTREDGESLVAIYGRNDGLSDFVRLEPDNLREPKDSAPIDRFLQIGVPTNWSFGVHTLYDERQRRIDHSNHAGYHIVFDEAGRDWDYLPAWPQRVGAPSLDNKAAHLIRRNVTRSAKRGVSDYWPLQVDLEREDKLSENLSVGAAVQAAIAWIEEHPPGTPKAQAQRQIADALDHVSSILSAGKDRKQNKLRPGTKLDVSAGKKYHAGPMGQLRSPIFIEVSQALMRRIGIRWLMPEYMISGDASNANFASTLVSEAPFVKARQADQMDFAREFRWILFKALKISHDRGRFSRWVRNWGQLRELVDVSIQPGPVATRDRATLIQELTALYDRQLIDGNEFRVETGREESEEYEGVKTQDTVIQREQPEDGDEQGGATRRSAISAALESVSTTEEARAILESTGAGDGTTESLGT